MPAPGIVERGIMVEKGRRIPVFHVVQGQSRPNWRRFDGSTCGNRQDVEVCSSWPRDLPGADEDFLASTDDELRRLAVETDEGVKAARGRPFTEPRLQDPNVRQALRAGRRVEAEADQVRHVPRRSGQRRWS